MSTNAQRFVVDVGWQVLLRDLGLDPGDLLRHARLPHDLFSQPAPSLSIGEYFRLWHSLEALMDDPRLPLRLGQAISVEAYSPPLFACFCSPDFNTAMGRLARYKPLIGPLRLALEVATDSTRLRLTGLETHQPPPPGLIATELVFLIHLARVATREPFPPLSVTSPVSLPAVADYEAFFGCAVQQGRQAELIVAAEDARRPFLTVNHAMFARFEPELAQRLDQLTRASGFRERVRGCLMESVASGCCSIQEVAGRLAVSPRTLQRKLREEGTSFQQELNATRRELASHYLRQTRYSSGEIAFLLGFDDPNSFIRAFRGWTGSTPAAYREMNCIW